MRTPSEESSQKKTSPGSTALPSLVLGVISLALSIAAILHAYHIGDSLNLHAPQQGESGIGYLLLIILTLGGFLVGAAISLVGFTASYVTGLTAVFLGLFCLDSNDRTAAFAGGGMGIIAILINSLWLAWIMN